MLRLSAQYVTEVPATIPKNALETELAVSFENFNDENHLDVPNMFLKYAISERTEVHLQSGFNHILNSEESFSNFGQLRVGFKTKVMEQQRGLPSLFIMADLGLHHPAGNGKYHHLNPAIYLLLGNVLSDKFEIQTNLGTQFDAEERKTTSTFSTALLCHPHEKISLFTEYFTDYSQNNFNHHTDFGVNYTVLPHLTFENSAGLGFGKDTPNYFFNFKMTFQLKLRN